MPWIVAGALLLVAAGAYAWWRDRRSTPDLVERDAGDDAAGAGPTAAPDERPATIEDLRAAADAALVAMDDAIRSSQQELGVARSEVGEDGVEPFTAAIDQAQGQLAQAFGTARKAQERAGTDAERPLLEEILATCAAADSQLDALAPRFDALRDLEGRVGVVLTHLADDLAIFEDRLTRAAATAGTLRTQYPSATIAGVVDDLDQATERLRFARASITAGEQLLSSADRLGAAARARAAEEALVQAATLLQSVDRSPKVLAKAQEAVTTLLRQTERDIAEVERLGVADDLAAKGQYARETLGWAGQEVSSGGYDPLEMRRALQDTDVALGRALGPIRPADDTLERALSLLATAWYGARAAVRAADELIMTRRGAVGLEARVRLSEARDHHVTGTALGDSDPTAALRHLRTADALAYQARTLAQQDEAAWLNARRMSAGVGELDSVLLGGILIESRTASADGVATKAGGVARSGLLGPPSFGGRATRARRVGHGSF
jgi:hypothetical protein